MEFEWKEWDGVADLAKIVLVETVDGTIVTAQQSYGAPKVWKIYVPGTALFFHPTLESRVVKYFELEGL